MEIQLFGETARESHGSCPLENTSNFPHESDSFVVSFLMGNHWKKNTYFEVLISAVLPSPTNNKAVQQNRVNK